MPFPSAEEKAHLQGLAAVEGFGHDFNGWLLLKLHGSLSGNVYPAGYVEGIQTDLERVRGWLESAREDAASSAAEAKALRAPPGRAVAEGERDAQRVRDRHPVLG